MDFKLSLLVWVIGIFKTSLCQDCNLSRTEIGDCVLYKSCAFIQNLADPLPPETFDNIRLRLRKCQGVSSNHICCEKSAPTPAPTIAPVATEAPYLDPVSINRNQIETFDTESCGISIGSRISYGNETKPMEFPWQVLLGYRAPDGSIKYQCGGALISKNFVLTAAHCIHGHSNIYSVRLGEHNLDTEKDCDEDSEDDEEDCADPVQDIIVRSALIHPNYNTGGFATNDIALIRLTTPANLEANNVKAICLPLEDNLKNNLPKKVIVTGFGATEDTFKSKEMLQGLFPIYPLDQCYEKFKKNKDFVLTDKQFCAGGESKADSCKGDSGGPAMYTGSLNKRSRFILYGIVSFGVRVCGVLEGYPGIYTRVGAYMDWITSNAIL